MILASFFEALFKYDFIFYALIAGILVGVLAPMIGSVVVIRRLSFIADTISHFSLAGVCLGVILSRIILFKNIKKRHKILFFCAFLQLFVSYLFLQL